MLITDYQEKIILQCYTAEGKFTDRSFKEARNIQQGDLDNLLLGITGSEKQPSWSSYTSMSDLPADVRDGCKDAIQYLVKLRNAWRSDSIAIPEAWKVCTEGQEAESGQIADALDGSRLGPSLALVDDKISYISDARAKAEHDDLTAVGPDFLLSERLLSARFKWNEASPLDRRAMLRSCLPDVANVVDYDGEEIAAEDVVPAMFNWTPRSLIKCPPRFEFHDPIQTSLETPSKSIDFVVTLRSSFPPPDEPTEHDASAPITLAHPALLVGTKGPIRWTSTRVQHGSRVDQRDTLLETLHDVNDAVQPSLTAHLINWKHGLHRDAPLRSLRQMPAEIMVLGIVYDADSLRIVGCFPQIAPDDQVARYISVVIDELPFARRSSITADFISERLRVATALLTLRKHAYRLAGYWVAVNNYWYQFILDIERQLEEIYVEQKSVRLS
ncbi:hypothetical protein EVG20_g390 [Dentipellis fragilis]|uniref:Uncharacterized protein n=1 Tax=Dentipellis fragilis TaxID=205917 RepID=A0A4Y9ZDG3_9AGAM|nr:hypothetical protein EVG20_g390 [Dentipellis fragilis]